MGLTRVTVKVSNLTRSVEAVETEFLVDTGAIDCMAPGKMLEETGIEVEGKAFYELANGESVEYNYGFAIIELMGDRTVTQIIFGPDNCDPILGVVVLESIGIVVDPVSKTLKRLAAKPLK